MEYTNFNEKVTLDKNKLGYDTKLPTLDIFIKSARECLTAMNIDTTSKVVFYKRSREGQSVLGVQLLDGDVEELSNYVVFDYAAENIGNIYHCQSKMYAEGKASPKANEFATFAIDSITTFFSMTESDLHARGEDTKVVDCMKTIGVKKEFLGGVFSKILGRKEGKKRN